VLKKVNDYFAPAEYVPRHKYVNNDILDGKKIVIVDGASRMRPLAPQSVTPPASFLSFGRGRFNLLARRRRAANQPAIALRCA
jgi:hypothetical protein